MDTPGRIAELERKFAENPRRYFAALANEFRKQGEHDRAIELCEAHLAEQRNHLSGHVVLAQALVDAGRESDAWDPLHTALDLDPENFIALRLIGELFARVGDVDHARTYFFRALEIEPRNEELLAAVKNLSPRPVPREPAAAEQEEPAGAQVAAPPSWGDITPLQGLDSTIAFDAEAAAEPVAEEVGTTDGQSQAGAGGEPPEPAPGDDWVSAAGPVPTEEAGDWDAARDTEEPKPAPAERYDHHDWLPPLPTEDAEPVASPVPEGLPEPAPDEPRPALASETMADLYLEQGHASLAIDVLRELVGARPDDERLRARLAELETQAVAPPRETVRDMFARFARTSQQLRERAHQRGAPPGVGGDEPRDAGPLADFFAGAPGPVRGSRTPPDALLAMLAPRDEAAADEGSLAHWLATLRSS